MATAACPELTAEALLESINKCYKIVLPNREPMELIGVPSPANMYSLPSPSSTRSKATSAGSKASSTSNAAPESTTSPSFPPTAELRSSTGADRRTGSTKGNTKEVQKKFKSSSWQMQMNQYWTPQKSGFWGFIVAFSVLAFWWQRSGADWVESMLVTGREKRRRAGERFDEDTNIEDLFSITTGVKVDLEVTAAPIPDNGDMALKAKGEFARREAEILPPSDDDIEVAAQPQDTQEEPQAPQKPSKKGIPAAMTNLVLAVARHEDAYILGPEGKGAIPLSPLPPGTTQAPSTPQTPFTPDTPQTPSSNVKPGPGSSKA
eukprot:gene8979-16115_t